ncbi:MAG TPA: hypothetical protein VFZ35_01130 [Sphingomicrobium sp.]
MTQHLLERTVREWVSGNPVRGAEALSRLAGPSPFNAGQSAEEVADALIRLAGRMEIAENRAW